MFERQGMILILSGPSGSGKSTLKQALLDHDSHIVFSVSATTRPPRPGEQPGVDYIFMSEEAFSSGIEQGEFLEHIHVFGHRYGTLRAQVDHALDAGRDIVFDINADGAQSLAEARPLETVRILILPPSLEILEHRLHGRANGETASTVPQRVREARQEIQKCLGYDYVIVNADVAQAAKELGVIVRAERHKLCRQTQLKQRFYEPSESKS